MKKILSVLITLLFVKGAEGQCWQSISAGMIHSLGVNANGALFSWGSNYIGQLGNGSTVDNHTPTQVGTSLNWKLVSAGDAFSLAIKTDGTLWA